jgi:peptide/nickel transport system permease protein
MGPIVMFGVAIYAFQLMAEGFQHHLVTGSNKRKKRKTAKERQKEVSMPHNFDFIQNKGA